MPAFNFSFSGDDIEVGGSPTEDAGEEEDVHMDDVEKETGKSDGPEVEVRLHSLEEMLSSLPSQISYTTPLISIPSSPSRPSSKDHTIHIPRRAIFDIRMQLMAEDDDFIPATGQSSATLSKGQDQKAWAGLMKEGDIERNVYEGGFKSWECSEDLVRYLAVAEREGLVEDEEEEEGLHVLENIQLGAGTALPSLAIFPNFLLSSQDSTISQYTNPPPLNQKSQTNRNRRKRLHLTLCDYNSSVLRLATIPNLLLTWAMIRRPPCVSAFPSDTPSEPLDTSSHHPSNPTDIELTAEHSTHSSSSSSREPNEHPHWPPESDLPLTPPLVQAFLSDLTHLGIGISCISGPWCPRFSSLITSSPPPSPPGGSKPSKWRKLLLASETIYAPATIPAFTQVMTDFLCSESGVSPLNSESQVRDDRPEVKATALVAAKSIYFGVGGGVDEFRREIERQGRSEGGEGRRRMKVEEVYSVGGQADKAEGVGGGGGVRRVILRVQPAS
ncbi:MAG: hypothetical protein M1817_002442 [Caeruleum heppii]|nr:MAG: hypothetical protein M1817_002442 [Caeruleum heppii]